MIKRLPLPLAQNNLICTLPAESRKELERHLEPVDLERAFVLEAVNERPRHAYFPLEGIGSIVSMTRDGRRIESGLFGREGMSGMAIVLGGHSIPNEIHMQISGSGLRIEADHLSDLMARDAVLRAHLLRYVQTLLVQVSHTTLVNGHATLEERLARWLLMCHDRIHGDRLHLTHEYMSIMLGVRRAGVTTGTHLLEGKKLIRAQRGEIVILDREGLERQAGAAYGVPEAEYRRLFGATACNMTPP